MLKTFASAALIAALAMAATSSVEARGFSHQATTTGPRGGVYNRSSQCSGGACTWQRSGTGAAGRSFSSSGSGSCSGGSCTWKTAGSGSGGRTWGSQGSASCAGGACSSTATGTGPYGGTWTHNGSSAYTPPN